MTDDGSIRDGKIGYMRPPVHTRFQKGQSGNPRGREKGVRNFAVEVKRSLEIPVKLNDNGRQKRVSTQEALFMRLREKALKGDNRALETLLGLARTHNSNETSERPGDHQMAAEDQAILEAFVEDVRSRPTAVPGPISETSEPAPEGDRGDE
jgi:hypothetical protein